MKTKFELKPFDKVLVRDRWDEHWRVSMFAFYEEGKEYPYCCMTGYYAECIPYEGNEHLLGTTDAYVEPYEPKDGDFVYVENSHFKFIFIKKEGDALTEKYISLNVENGDLSDKYHMCCDDECIISIRPATEEEKRLLISKLHELGKDWDAEARKVVLYVPPYIPKSGDFVVSGWKEDGKECKWVAIVKGEYEENFYQTYYGRYIVKATDVRDSWYDESSDSQQYTRAASVDEIRFALDGLHNDGKDWDDDNEAIVDWEWKPKVGELIYFYDYCSQSGKFISCPTHYDKTDGQSLRDKLGNRFRTNEECIAKCDKLNKAIDSVK